MFILFKFLALLILFYQTGRMAEWLRRWPAKPMRNACVGSNPTSVEILLF